MKYDVLIIGAGVAGLYTALNISKDKKVLIVDKTRLWECNTYYAQGGICVARDDDDVALHIKDTVDAGVSMCNLDAVETLSTMSREVVQDLIDRGFEFDCDEKGDILYTKEAAHSTERIVHAGGDATGRHLHHFLLETNTHPILANATVIDLLIENRTICGIEILYKGELKQIFASQVVIASGGVGSLYEYHTNAYSISGDLQGICVEKGIELEMMEMMQFHPTVYVGNSSVQKQLLSEALRGEGAHIVNADGERFLFDYDDRGELAPRDIVSRAIFDYRKKHGGEVFLSFEEFERDYFRDRFPNISKSLSDLGYNIPKQKVPISPAFHYAIGGIKTDLDGNVESISGLYAVGEVASTGVHGANRLASNSLLEGLVFALRVAKALSLEELKGGCTSVYALTQEPLVLDGDKAKKERLREVMWQEVSIVRTTNGLKSVLSEIEAILAEPIGRLLRLRLYTAREIVQSALKREKSVGVHYRV